MPFRVAAWRVVSFLSPTVARAPAVPAADLSKLLSLVPEPPMTQLVNRAAGIGAFLSRTFGFGR